MTGSMPSVSADASRSMARAALDKEGHLAGRAGQIEDTVFGVLDGVITSLAIVVGVAAISTVQKLSPYTEFLTVTVAAAAGSLSMFVGALLSAQSRARLIRRERDREEREVREKPDEEREEVRRIYAAQGFSEAETETLVNRVTSDPKRWVDMMMRDELGLVTEADPTPLGHGAVIGTAYFIGGILPAFPFLFGSSVIHAMFVSLGVGSLELAAIGILVARYSGGHPARIALEIVLVGMATALAVFLLSTGIQGL